MIKFKGFVIYFGTKEWGWRLYGFGYKNIWFIGYSRNAIVKGE